MNNPTFCNNSQFWKNPKQQQQLYCPPPTPTPLINRTLEEKTGKLAEAILNFCCCLFVCSRGVRSILLHPFCGSCFCTIGRAQTEMNPATTHLCAWIFCIFFWVELSTCAHFCIFACIFCLHAWCLEVCKTLGFMLLFIRAYKSSIFCTTNFHCVGWSHCSNFPWALFAFISITQGNAGNRQIGRENVAG